MTGPTVAYDYLSPDGVIVPDTAAIQTDVDNEYIEAFDDPALNLAPETPQGTLDVTEVNCRAAMTANNAAVANQINPNQSGGIFLEALCALTGVDVPESEPSIIAGVTVAGQPNTPIPAGSLAELEDDQGNRSGIFFLTIEQVTLNSLGTATVDFESQEDGPIAAAPGQLRFVVSDVLGWETVSNASAASLGSLAPSDPELRQLRNNTLALQGHSIDEAIISNVQDVSGVVLNGVQFRQNVEPTSQTIDGIFLKANSIWVCVQGGADVDVANAIRVAKDGGCGYNGSVTVNITDPASGQVCPVSFDRPVAFPIQVAIAVKLPNTSYTAQDVLQSILDYGAGLVDGQQGFVVGSGVSPFDIASGPTKEIPGIYVRSIQVAPLGGNYTTSEIPLNINQVATLSANNIQVTLNQ